MDGAGTTIFDRIEQKLSAAGVEVDVSDLKEAVSQYDAKIVNNPADVDSKIIGLELKLVLVARLLSAAVDALPQGGVCAAPASEAAATAQNIFSAAPAAQAPANAPKKKRLMQNPATGVIEEVEVTEETGELIVADGRARFGSGGGKGGSRKEEKKCVFISAVDDEAVPKKK